MAKRRTKLSKGRHQKDWLSELPDEILVSILSLLTLKEMQRTSVLAKRWRYLWTFTTCRLDFNDSELLSLVRTHKRRNTSNQQNFSYFGAGPNFMILGNVENMESEWTRLRNILSNQQNFSDFGAGPNFMILGNVENMESEWTRLRNMLGTFVSLENMESERTRLRNMLQTRFVSWVNQALELHQGNTIDEFRVVFDMDGTEFKSEIDNWICFSLRKKVKKLSLNFMMGEFNAYPLTSQIFHSYSLDSLTDLSLSSVKVSGEILEYVLSNCPFIELLHVQYSESLVKLKTSSPLPKLKHLEILDCYSLKQIQISAINLVSFKYSGRKKVKILLGDVPNFVDLSVQIVTGDCFHYILKNDCPFSRYLSQLETLVLDFFITEFFWLSKFPELRNLRLLKLDLYPLVNSLHCCTSLLNASPVLHRFVLKFNGLNGPRGGKIKVPRAKYPHQCLKVVELIGFFGCTIDMGLALYVINNAPSLEKIIIDTRSPCVEEILHDSSDPEKLATLYYVEKLKTRLAPGVELVVL